MEVDLRDGIGMSTSRLARLKSRVTARHYCSCFIQALAYGTVVACYSAYRAITVEIHSVALDLLNQ